MLKLKTIASYGLNDIFQNEMINTKNCNTSQLFNTCRNNNKRGCRGSGKNRKDFNKLYNDEIYNLFYKEIKEAEIDFNENFNYRIAKNLIFSTKNKFFKIIENVLNNYRTDNQHFLLLINDLCKSRMPKLQAKHPERTVVYMTINFKNPIYDKLKFNSVLKKFTDLLPIKHIQINRCFRFDKTIGRKIFNYNSLCKNSKNNRDNIQCLCTKLEYCEYVDPFHNHILTGNLDIIENKELWN